MGALGRLQCPREPNKVIRDEAGGGLAHGVGTRSGPELDGPETRGRQRGQVTLEADGFCRPTSGDDRRVCTAAPIVPLARTAAPARIPAISNVRKLAGWWVTLWADQAHGVDQLGGITEVG